jgi:hypothetical protein
LLDAVDDVMINGELIIKKGTMVPAHYVSGSITMTPYAGTICSATVGVAINSEFIIVKPRGSLTSVPVKPGGAVAEFRAVRAAVVRQPERAGRSGGSGDPGARLLLTKYRPHRLRQWAADGACVDGRPMTA